MENNNYTFLAILVGALVGLVVLGLGLQVVNKQASTIPSSANYSCTNGGASAPSSVTTPSGTTSAVAPGATRYGSGSESAIFGDTTVTSLNSSGAVTSSAFLAATTLSLGVNAGTAVTSTFTGVTSTLSFPGRTCFSVISSTGTRWTITWDNGQINKTLNGTCN